MGETRPLCIDLFCGLGGWTEGFLAEGYDVIGFDIEQHVYGEHRYPAQLVIQDVCTLHGSQFRDADCIVASSPCQAYSYMAMPWQRAKQIARALRGVDVFPDDYVGARTIDELNALFLAPQRIQREASEAAGRWIPMVQENVKGTQPWVGPAQWHYGSYYLWGDVPALMPVVPKARKVTKAYAQHGSWKSVDGDDWRATENTGGHGKNPDGRKNGGDWFGKGADCSLQRRAGSKSSARKAASARIAKIPFPLAQHIARVYHPGTTERVA
jgi:hypothetical protein